MGGQLLVDIWSTSVLYDNNNDNDNTDRALITSMAMVRLPSSSSKSNKHTAATSAIAKQIQDTLHYDYCIEVPVKVIHGKLYVRISAHIYNNIHDYETLGHAVLRMSTL